MEIKNAVTRKHISSKLYNPASIGQIFDEICSEIAFVYRSKDRRWIDSLIASEAVRQSPFAVGIKAAVTFCGNICTTRLNNARHRINPQASALQLVS